MFYASVIAMRSMKILDFVFVATPKSGTLPENQSIMYRTLHMIYERKSAISQYDKRFSNVL